jgi:hypothetical protein
MIWEPERSRHQGRIVAALFGRAAGVPARRRLVLSGGPRGAAKDVALEKAGLDPARYLAVSVDGMLAELARRSLIPVVAGLAPLEAADLVHVEAQHVAKRLTARAMAAGTNVLLDVTAASWPSVRSWLHVADLAGYGLDVVMADLGAEAAARWADAEHRRGQERYRQGAGDGGRYVPAEAAGAVAALAAATGERPWSRHIAHLGRRRPVRFPGGEVVSLIEAYRAGLLSLDDLAGQFQDRPWPAVPPACPPEAPEAGPAVDDLEPWQPGSFDEVVLACDLGMLGEADYAVLARAAAG